MASLDIFNNDAFSLTSMTKAINDTPFQPGRIAQLGWFSEEPINTLSVMIEKRGNALSLVPASTRGASGQIIADDKRSMIPFAVTHLPQRDTIVADVVTGLRTFGSETELETVQTVVNRRLAKLRRNMDVTIEYQRMGAIKGIVMDADGSTPLLNLFTAFGVSQNTKAMGLNSDTTKVKQKVVEAKRAVETELGGLSYTSLRVLCSSTFFDALVGHPAVEKAYDMWQQGGQIGAFLREDQRQGFYFCGVFWEEYRGTVNGTQFIADGEAYMVPEGVPDLFVTNFAPADYMETVNTLGLPYYAKQEALRMNKGIEIEAQSNPLHLCTRPRAVLKLTIS